MQPWLLSRIMAPKGTVMKGQEVAKLFQTYFEGKADRLKVKDECQREFKHAVKNFWSDQV